MAQSNETPRMTFTTEDIQKIIAAAVAAAKEPNELEKLEMEEKREQLEARRAQIEQDQQTRRETAQQQIAIMENRRAMQGLCTHKHRRGDTHCVFVNDELGGYVLCQKCQAVIRPGVAPQKNDSGVIFDTVLFNRLLQECTSNGFFE